MMTIKAKSLFSCLLFIPFLSANADNVDPCENIVGTWQGTYSNRTCKVEAVAQFNKYKSTIRMNLRLDDKSKYQCQINEVNFTSSGTCTDAMIMFLDGSNMKGTIFDNSIHLKNTYEIIDLKKK
jgi:hypothetical protein